MTVSKFKALFINMAPILAPHVPYIFQRKVVLFHNKNDDLKKQVQTISNEVNALKQTQGARKFVALSQ
jgi:hypothetical protein